MEKHTGNHGSGFRDYAVVWSVKEPSGGLYSLQVAWATLELVFLLRVRQMKAPASISFERSTPWDEELHFSEITSYTIIKTTRWIIIHSFMKQQFFLKKVFRKGKLIYKKNEYTSFSFYVYLNYYSKCWNSNLSKE